MTEISIVRENLMTQVHYSPYCGNQISRSAKGGCDNPRTHWDKDKNQFVCPRCKYTTEFPIDFIIRYKKRWGIE